MDEINLLDYVDMLKQRKRTVAAVTLAVVLVVGVVLAVMPRTYEGKTTLLFPRQMEGGLGARLAAAAGLADPGTAGGYTGREIYFTILTSRTISEAVLKRVNLDGKCDLGWNDLQNHIVLTRSKEGGMTLACRAPTSWLRGHVPGRELKGRTAQLAADLANTYVSELDAYDKANSLFMGRKMRLYIEEQLARTERELAEAEAKLKVFQEEHPTLVPPESSSVYAEQALDMVARQVDADIALEEVREQIATVRAIWREGAPEGVSPEAFISSPIKSDLQGQIAKLEVRRATLLEDFTETHPEVVGVTQEIEKTKDRVRTETARIIEGKASSLSPAHQELLKQMAMLEVDRNGIEARKSALAAAVSKIESWATDLPPKELEYARLARSLRAVETVYLTLHSEHAKARIVEGQDSDYYIVLDKAIVPKGPAKPRVKLTLAIALMMGLMLGVVTAVVQGIPARR